MNNKKLIIIPGFRKCGTTSVYDFINSHGYFNTTNVKEPQVLISSEEFDIERYLSFFPNNDKSTFLDGSTFILSDIEKIQKISQYFDEVKVIICLRDPVKRFFSAYWHHKGKSPSIENRLIEDIVSNLENDGVSSELVGLNEKCKAYYDSSYLKRVNGLDCDFNPLDRYFAFRYYSEGLYSNYLNKLDLYNLDYKILYFDDFVSKPYEVTEKLSIYLGHTLDVDKFKETSNSNKSYDRSSISPIIITLGKWIFSVFSQRFKDKVKSVVFQSISRDDYSLHERVKHLYSNELSKYGKYKRNLLNEK